MKPLKDYSLSKFEVENLFRNRLNTMQINNIALILNVLAKYMLLDRTMLQERIGEKIGLSFLALAVDYGLIVEYKYKNNNAEEEKPKFFFALNTAGFTAVGLNGGTVNKLPLMCSYGAKNRVLTFNRWALNDGYTLQEIDFPNFNFFICKNANYQDVIGYFEDKITEEKITEHLNKADINYIFKKIEIPIIEMGNNTKANENDR